MSLAIAKLQLSPVVASDTAELGKASGYFADGL